MMSIIRFLKNNIIIPIIVLIAIVLFLTYLYLWMPFIDKTKSHVTDSIVLDDGREILLMQTYNSFSEPYTVSLYVELQDSNNWGWYYIGHEEFYWHNGSLRINDSSKSVAVLKGKDKVGEYYWDDDRYVRHVEKNEEFIFDEPQEIIAENPKEMRF